MTDHTKAILMRIDEIQSTYVDAHRLNRMAQAIKDNTLALAAEREALIAAFHELMEHVPKTDEPGEPEFSIAVDHGVDHIIFPNHWGDDPD